ncbi:GNAT family N-acetyltransferase [Paractinoplanes rishiriensis]|uniref:N-acetyltransferase n=1 Tax=Paractinoplanes rishiriensis TaxID=1050105 RepID=A0A919KAU0_9ACTN|nr:GNAT family N-acetyltransferase [Actinoplanes rishiriensis]GIF01704.1 N-acetyltransferase [Actinoplanes rishiriensis]
MPWSTSPDVRDLLTAAGDFLRDRPVDHTVLLTEAAYLTARPSTATDQLYGWWDHDGVVAGAFLQAPRHPPILSTMPGEALESLPHVLPGLTSVGVDGRSAGAAVTAWRSRTGATLTERSRITLYRLAGLRLADAPPGRPRTATPADRDLLVSWYRQLMAAYPDDPSDLAYVVDDPIGYGGITLWEVDGTPVAMAGRSRLVAGMVRLGAVHAPHDERHGEAAFEAACAAATETARDVLVFAGADDAHAGAAYRKLGFLPVLDRVMLATDRQSFN